MKILLIRPALINTGLEFVSSQPPLNLCYLASVAREAGAEVRILDFEVERLSAADYRKYIIGYEPNLVGLTVMTPTVNRAGKLADITKSIFPRAIIVAGGPHISALPDLTLKQFPQIDVCVCGEGETAFGNIIKRYKTRDFKDIPGIVYRDISANICDNRAEPFNEDIDSLPFPARDLLKIKKYRGQAYRGFSRDFLRISEMITSRGCPGKCIFCAINVTHGRKVRLRSIENIALEIEHLKKRYKTNHLVFLDDTFTYDHCRLSELLVLLRESGISWNCTTRADSVNGEILHEMAAAGCRGVAFGVESGSSRIMQLIGKNITKDQIRNAFKASREAGIEYVEADFMLCSHPDETRKDIEETRNLIKELKPTVLFLSIAVPYPGTQLFEIMKDENLIDNNVKWEDFLMYGTGNSWRTKHFTLDELLKIQANILRSYYLSFRYVRTVMSRIKNLPQFYYYLKSGLALLGS